MCNAHNHSRYCDCGFGGWRPGTAYYDNVEVRPLAEAFSGETFESYLNPNACCPVCGAHVYFFRSRFNGRVFFDTIGPPWDKHPCTDNGGPIYAPRPSEKCKAEKPAWKTNGWEPVFNVRVSESDDGWRINCNLTKAIELHVLEPSDPINKKGPIFVRQRSKLKGFYDITYLSHYSAQLPVTALSVEGCLMHLNIKVLKGAAKRNKSSLASLGRYILYHLGDFDWAESYLKKALFAGDESVLLDLLIIALQKAIKR
ncbi:hypothetical protein [Rhodomicrobium lacus]|uniref:hypothetical protein n=1 Tax=Rhodomicrobium lacus TaxID=2498452 RepID=UPI0026E25A4E|nr:hypothetical protein [Rhodomicrobium lacus]WKW51948.1 hypothetical protein QMO75_05570 [Rhodomicrobium lacus]